MKSSAYSNDTTATNLVSYMLERYDLMNKRIVRLNQTLHEEQSDVLKEEVIVVATPHHQDHTPKKNDVLLGPLLTSLIKFVKSIDTPEDKVVVRQEVEELLMRLETCKDENQPRRLFDSAATGDRLEAIENTHASCVLSQNCKCR